MNSEVEVAAMGMISAARGASLISISKTHPHPYLPMHRPHLNPMPILAVTDLLVTGVRLIHPAIVPVAEDRTARPWSVDRLSQILGLGPTARALLVVLFAPICSRAQHQLGKRNALVSSISSATDQPWKDGPRPNVRSKSRIHPSIVRCSSVVYLYRTAPRKMT